MRHEERLSQYTCCISFAGALNIALLSDAEVNESYQSNMVSFFKQKAG
jgi:hypothetical protein